MRTTPAPDSAASIAPSAVLTAKRGGRGWRRSRRPSGRSICRWRRAFEGDAIMGGEIFERLRRASCREIVRAGAGYPFHRRQPGRDQAAVRQGPIRTARSTWFLDHVDHLIGQDQPHIDFGIILQEVQHDRLRHAFGRNMIGAVSSMSPRGMRYSPLATRSASPSSSSTRRLLAT